MIRRARAATVLSHIAQEGIIKSTDAEELGSSPAHLRGMAKRGQLRKVGPGLFVDEKAPLPEYDLKLALVTRRCKRAFVCGPTAAFFHDLLPPDYLHPIWIGIGANDRRPTGFRNLYFNYFSGERATRGLEPLRLDALPLPFSTRERAVCELFRARKLIGEKIPRVALRNYRANHPNELSLAFMASAFGVTEGILSPPLAGGVQLTPEDLAAYIRTMAAKLRKKRKRT